MSARKEKVVSMSEAVHLIKDGDTVALGGHTMRRHPMALIREIIRQRKRDLKLIGWNNGIDIDILVGAGCARSVQTSYVGMSHFGLACRFRAAAETGKIEVFEESETTALDRFRAGAQGLTFYPSKTPIATVIADNPDVKEIRDPFTGEPYYALKAWMPDVAIIHAHSSDPYGNILLDPDPLMENVADGIIARAARATVVSVEEIVSPEYVYKNAHRTLIPSFFVTAVVEAPYGAHPCSCDARYDYDLDHIAKYYEASKDQAQFDDYLAKYVFGCPDHPGYLEKIGLKSAHTRA